MLEKIKLIKKEYLYTGIVILFFFCTTSFFYTKWQRASIQNDINENKIEKKVINKTIKSINDLRTDNIDNLVEESKINNKKAKQIIKSISHEKTIIPDTTNAAMLEYIANYKFRQY